MKISQIETQLNYRSLWEGYADKEAETAYTSDLLSDVMGNSKEGSIFITMQAHKNTVAVASLKDFPAVIFCNGRGVPQDAVDAAKEEGIALFMTKEDQFSVSVKIGKLLGL